MSAPDVPITPNAPGPAAAPQPCRHLRHNGMYIMADDRSVNDDEGARVYWCQRSLKHFGPDDDYVDRASCTNPERSCHEPF